MIYATSGQAHDPNSGPGHEGRRSVLAKILGGARTLAQRAFFGTIWSQLLILLALVVAIHWRLLFDDGGYVTWGNYLLPYTSSQYAAYYFPPSVWSPFQYTGVPLLTPFASVINYVTAIGPLGFFSFLVGAASAAKIYVVVSTMFLGYAFLLLCEPLIRNYWGRLAGAVLIVAGPFQLQLYGQGDYVAFVSEAFVFLAIYFLWRAVTNPSTRWVFYPASMAALLMSISTIQIFALGFVFYVAFLVVYVMSSASGSIRTRFASLSRFSVRLLALPLLLSPLVLPLLSASIDLGPSSSYALPLSTFQYYTTNPLSIFFLFGYVGSGPAPLNFLGYQMVSASAGPVVAVAWAISVVALVVATWAGLLILRDRRGYFLLAFAALGSLLGSGPYGPLGALNVYLYLHLVGYQALNTSYYWDWMIVVPATALGLGVLVERLQERVASDASSLPYPENTHAGANDRASPRRHAISKRPDTHVPRVTAAALATLVVVSVALPFAVGAQYGPEAIRTIDYPSDYSEIPHLLGQLIGSSYAGVALFNPDVNWFLSNSSEMVQNAFFLFPNVRTPGLPFYASPPYASNFYYYWVYKQFYTNSTRYLGQLLGAVGIEYLLVFYGTQSASFYPYFLQFSYGKNASMLLKYQYGIEQVISAKDFAIYRNLNYSKVAVSLDHLSVVAGGYSELNAMAYAGINLTNQGLIFPSDIPAGRCPQYMDRVSRIYVESMNAIYGLGVVCNAISTSNPLDSIPTGLGPSEAWSSSDRLLGGSIWDSWPTPLAVTYGGPHSLDLSLNAGGCSAGCSLWMPIRFSGDGGLLSFQWETDHWQVNTSRGWGGYNNTMVWVNLPFGPVRGSGVLQITSLSGWNAIGTLYVAPSPGLSDWVQSIAQSKSVLVISPGEVLEAPAAVAPGQASGYCPLSTGNALAGQSLCLTANGDTPLALTFTLPNQSGGWLSMLVRSIGTAHLLIGRTPDQIFGFDSGDYDDTHLSMSWLRIPVRSAQLAANNTLTVWIANGSVFLSIMTFTPFSTYPTPTPLVPGPNLTISSVYYTSNVTGFNVSVVNTNPGESLITGSFRFKNATWDEGLAFVEFDQTPSLASDLALQYDVSPGLILNINGALIGGRGESGFVQISSGFYYEQLHPPYSHFYMSVATYSNHSLSNGTASFTVQLATVKMPLESDVTDVAIGSNWSVTGGTQGYQLVGGPTPLVLVRVSYFSDLAVTPSGTALSSAYGSINTLVWNPTNRTLITVYPASLNGLNVGYLIMGATLGVWIAVEYFWNRRRERTPTAAAGTRPPRSSEQQPSLKPPHAGTAVMPDNPAQGVPPGEEQKPKGRPRRLVDLPSWTTIATRTVTGSAGVESHPDAGRGDRRKRGLEPSALEARKRFLLYVPNSTLTQFHNRSPWLMYPRSLRELGWESTLICGRLEGERPAGIRVVETGLVVNDPPKEGKLARSVFDPLLAFREIVNRKPDLVLVSPIRSSLASFLPLVYLYRRVSRVARSRRTRFVLKADWDGDFTGLASWEAIASMVLVVLSTFVLDLVSVETSCAVDKARNLPLIRGDKVVRVPLGFPQNNIVQQRYDGSTRAPVILCVGRIARMKGQDVLLRAFSILAPRFPQWSVSLVGPVDDVRFMEELLEYVNRSSLRDRVAFRGFVDESELDQEYSRASIFCLPSVQLETAGQVKYEATARGAPVVTTDVPCGRDAAAMGWLVARAGDPADLASKLEELMRDEGTRRRASELAQSRQQSYVDLVRSYLAMLDLEQAPDGMPKDRKGPRATRLDKVS